MNYPKALWKYLKDLGFFKDYNSYSAWHKEKYNTNSLEDFKENMTDDERREFEFMFENDDESVKSGD